MKHLFAFFMIGAAMYVGEDFVSPKPNLEGQSPVDRSAPNWRPESVVNACSSRDETTPWEQREESFLLCFASHFEWYYSDDIIQKRLTENMERLSLGSETTHAPAAEAIRLGADQLDPIVKRRRIQRALLELRRLVKQGPSAVIPGTTAAIDSLRMDFSHLYFTDEQRLHEKTRLLSNQPPAKLDMQSLGEPFFYGARLTSLTLGEIEKRFGSEFKEKLSAVDMGKWSHPIRSELGWHLVWVHDRSWLTNEAPSATPLSNVASENEENAKLVQAFLQAALTKSESLERMLR